MKKHILQWTICLSCAVFIFASARAEEAAKPAKTIKMAQNAPIRSNRKVYTEYALTKMTSTLCTEGFKAYVGSQHENVCSSKAREPDIAYTCIWDRKGGSAYPPTVQGPCTLDYAEHRGNLVVNRQTHPDDKPLRYGTEVQCCYRASAAGGGDDSLMIEAASY